MSNIDDANKFGSLLNSWGKIFIVVGGALISCAMAYYRIFENEKEIESLKNQLRERIKTQEERSDKRYDRAMETAAELKDILKYHESRILSLQIDNAYLKGNNENIRQDKSSRN